MSVERLADEVLINAIGVMKTMNDCYGELTEPLDIVRYKFLQELKEYRDTGLTPEQVWELAEKKQSRREWYQKGYADGKKDAENDRWIPVEERLPEVGEKVIVTDISGRVWSDIFTYSFARARDTRPCFNRCDNEYWQCYKPDVIAWQPLPKSYRPEKGDK